MPARQTHPPLSFGEALVADWQAAGVIKPSVFKPVFTTIGQSLIVRTMGMLNNADQHALRGILPRILG